VCMLLDTVISVRSTVEKVLHQVRLV
jgi:hypothetical protein